MHLRLENLYTDYCQDCGGLQETPSIHLASNSSKSLFNRLKKAVSSSYALLHKNKEYKAEDITQYSELISQTNNIFKDAIQSTIADNVVPVVMKTALENDIFVFSALKTHAQLFEASRQLLKDDGTIKPFYKFSQDVKSIKSNYNQNYLEAEYQFAVSSSQQAAKWAKIQENAGRYDLQYRTAKDDRVRDSHEKLDGITLSSEDVFWNEYFPPNGWRCRCLAIEVLKGKYPVSDPVEAMAKGQTATSQIDKNGKNKLEIFRFNPGKQKVVFPENHPYSKVQGADVVKDLKYRDLVFSKPLNEQYSSVYKHSSGGKVLVHELAGIGVQVHPSDDYIDRISTAKSLAKEGQVVHVNPVINRKNIEARSLIYKDLNNENSNPDYRIETLYYDLKRPKSINNIIKNANDSSKQGAIAIISDIQLNKKLTLKVAEQKALGIFAENNKKYYSFDEVLFIIQGKMIKYKR